MAVNFDKKEDIQVENVSTIDGNMRDADLKHVENLAAALKNGTSQAEKDLVWKLDWRILPCVWILYLLGFLDRANVG